MPADGSPVTVWAGYASGKTTVFVMPKVTLTGTTGGRMAVWLEVV
jgi:hypothetical protein